MHCSVEGKEKEETALRDIQQAFQALRATLDHREEELCDRIRAVSAARKESVNDIIHACHQKEDALSNRQAMLSFLSTEGSQHEVISYHSLLNAGPTHRRSEAAVSRVMQFLPKQGAALQAAIESFGCVEVGACPPNCTLQPMPDKILMCIGNYPLVFTLTTANGEKTPCSVGGEMVQAFLRPRPPLPGARIKVSVDDMKNGQYRVTFDLLYTGHCELSVLVNGANIQGSPFSLGLDPTPESPFLLTRRDTIMGVLQFPDHPGCLSGVATTSDGTIFVTDHSNYEIHVFDEARNFHKSYGQGVGECVFLNPRSVVST